MKKGKNEIHIWLSKDMAELLDSLVARGLFSHKNEIVREAIRHVMLKYKEELKK